MLAASVEVAKEIAPKIKAVNYDGILISISNPCDIIADYLRRRTGLPASRVFGTGTALDSARLKRVLSEYTGVSAASINACSMGEHGDSQMIPFSCVTLHGVPFLKRYPAADCAAILERTRMIGMDIVNGKNATEFGIGCVLHDLVKAVLCDERRIIPVSAYLDGAYGQRGVHAGVPAVIGRGGIYEIPELPLLPEELAQFAASCDVIRTHIAMAARI